MKRQTGFTLIELVMVIVILGILAAVAVPQFVNLDTQAQQAATSSIAGSLGSASMMNYARERATATAGTTTTNCNQTGTLLEGGALPAGYAITAASLGAALGQSATCTLTHTASGLTATFRGMWVP